MENTANFEKFRQKNKAQILKNHGKTRHSSRNLAQKIWLYELTFHPLNDCASSPLNSGRQQRTFLLAENNLHTKINAILESFSLNICRLWIDDSLPKIIIQV